MTMCANTKLIKSMLLIALSLSLAACEVVKLDAKGEPIIPMSEEESALIMNMEPEAIANKLWPSVEAEYIAHTATIENLDITQDGSYFVNLDAIVDGYSENALGKTLTVRAQDLSFPLQLGPVVKGNSIRDSLSFVKFDQFKNQVQFAQFSKALNKKAVEGIEVPDESWIGENVELIAAITVKGGQVNHAVPLQLARK